MVGPALGGLGKLLFRKRKWVWRNTTCLANTSTRHSIESTDRLFLVAQQPENFWFGECFVHHKFNAGVNDPGNGLSLDM